MHRITAIKHIREQKRGFHSLWDWMMPKDLWFPKESLPLPYSYFLSQEQHDSYLEQANQALALQFNAKLVNFLYPLYILVTVILGCVESLYFLTNDHPRFIMPVSGMFIAWMGVYVLLLIMRYRVLMESIDRLKLVAQAFDTPGIIYYVDYRVDSFYRLRYLDLVVDRRVAV